MDINSKLKLKIKRILKQLLLLNKTLGYMKKNIVSDQVKDKLRIIAILLGRPLTYQTCVTGDARTINPMR